MAPSGRGGRRGRRECFACAVLVAAAGSLPVVSAWNHCVVPVPTPTGYSITGPSSASCAGGYTGSTVTPSCAVKWVPGDWASVGGAGAYDPGGNGANRLKAQSANIATYNGQPVTQATCHLAAAANGPNSDGEQPNGATWYQFGASTSCFANYRLTYPFTSPSSTQAKTTLFSSTDNGYAGGPTCSSNTCSGASGGCWKSCVNTFTYTGCTKAGCDASAAPTNGAVGSCTSALAAGQACTPTCNPGFTLTTPASVTTALNAKLDQGLTAAGAQTNHDLVISITWDEKADLDLHCTAPSGIVIMNVKKDATTGGQVDVDNQNGGAGSVENLFFTKPSNGDYSCSVKTCEAAKNTCPTCPACRSGIPFTARLTIKGQSTLRSLSSANENQQVGIFQFKYPVAPPPPPAVSSCSSAGVLTAATCVANACTVTAPNNGALGPCAASLASGASCNPACNSGYRVVGSMSCTNGALTSTATCVRIVCDASAAPANGGVGSCTNSLPTGSTCAPTCNPSFRLVGTASCTLNAGTNTGVFSGAACVANQCIAGSGTRTGFALSAAAATSTTVAGLGVIACYVGLPISYSGTPTATCLTDGGPFAFGGCNENTCTAGSGDRTGYSMSGAAATATKPSALGAITCAPGYSVAPGSIDFRPCFFPWSGFSVSAQTVTDCSSFTCSPGL
eukprot:COSAG01_NODE_868_length_13035_cov_4.786024_6_plen_677_part_00